MSITARPVTFEGAFGDELSGALHIPAGTPRAWVLFAHCFTCSKDLRAAVRIAEAMTEHGFGVLRFDFTGLGESEGEFADTNFSSNIQDLVAAARFLEERFRAPQVLVGHSLGGAAVIAAARELDSVRAVATIGAPADPAHVTELLEPARDELDERGEAEITLAGRTFRIKKQLIRDLEEQSLTDTLAELRCAFLFCHAPLDKIVGVDNARILFEAAKHPKSFLSLDRADHLLGDPDDARYAGRMIAAWLSRFIDVCADAARQEAEDGVVVVRGGATGYGQDIRAGCHYLRGDEPEDLGGDDSGPTPYDFLLAALGSCTSMTLRMYADRKNWPLEGVTVKLTHEKIHARDCDDCESESGKIDHIERRIWVAGDLSDEQRARLIEIADKCPVHRTLYSENVVRTTLEEGDG
jgi:putative redox protein